MTEKCVPDWKDGISPPKSCCLGGHISLETLLSSPLFWKRNSAKSCHFFTHSYNQILEKSRDQRSKNFKTKLFCNQLASDWMLWHPHGNWKDVLGDEHFKLVTTFHKTEEAEGQVDTNDVVQRKKINVNNLSSVVEILAIISSKYEHNALYEDGEMKILGWFCKQDGKMLLDKQLFANYWNSKFPQLEPFLWWQFHDFHCWPNSEEFYPEPDTRQYYRDRWCCDLVYFPHHLYHALQDHLEKGAVESRYLLGKESTAPTLEFRTLRADLIQRILDRNSAVEIEVSGNSVSCKWLGGTIPIEERLTSIKCSNNSENTDVFLGTIFIVSRLCDLDKLSVIEKCKPDKRIVIFTCREPQCGLVDKVIMESVARKFANAKNVTLLNMPIAWGELRKPVTGLVLERGELYFQQKSVGICDLLPQNDWVKNQLLFYLTGEKLNELLRNKTPVILKKHEPILMAGYHHQRLFYDRSKLNSSVFHGASEAETFVVTNITLDQLQVMVANGANNEVILVDDLDSFSKVNFESAKSRVFLLQNDIQHFGEWVYEALADAGIYRNVHFLRHLHEDTFSWLGTNKSLLQIEESFSKSAIQVGVMMEDELLENIEVNERHMSAIFISGKPGLGKRYALMSLARKLTEIFSERFVLIISMPIMLEYLKKRDQWKWQKRDIVSAIKDLSSSCEFEANLIEYWLLETSSSAVQFEIIFSDMDKVVSDIEELRIKSDEESDQEIALRVLSVIKYELPSVRMWSTLPGHILKEFWSEFGGLGYEPVPWTEQDQMVVLENHWLRYLQINKHKGGDQSLSPSSKNLQNLAKECLNIISSMKESEIASIPLQYRMISEIYEESVLQGDFSVGSRSIYSLVDLFKMFTDRKFENYMRSNDTLSATDSLRNDWDSVHMYCALKLIFCEKVANDFRALLHVTAFGGENFDSFVLGQDILQKSIPLTFIHKSVAEYFVARFIHKFITDPSLTTQESDSVYKFLWNEILAVKSRSSYSSFTCKFKFSTLCYFLNELLQEHTNKLAPSQQTIQLIFNETREMERNCPLDLFKRAPLFVTASKMGFTNIITLLASSPSKVWALYTAAIMSHRFDLIKNLIETSNSLSDNKFLLQMQEIDKSRRGILHWVILSLGGDCSQDEGLKVKDFIMYVVSKDRSFLEQKDAEGRTPLLLLLKELAPFDCDYFMEILQIIVTESKANVLATDNRGNTVLHVTHECISKEGYGDGDYCHSSMSLAEQYSKILDFFMQNGCSEVTINAVNWKGQTPLQSAVDNLGNDWFMNDLIASFKKYGAVFDVNSEIVCTALHVAIEEYLGGG